MSARAPGTLIAVTGGTGFLGRPLIASLIAQGFRVRALARRQPEGFDPVVEWVQGDLAAPGALSILLRDVDAVIHAAGAVKALRRADFFAVNAAGTAALAAAAAAQPRPPRFVHISSFAARAPQVSAYAASKAEAERAVLALAGRMPVVILRPPAVYGPGDREALKVLQTAARGFIPAPDVPAARLSLVHVEDAVKAVLAGLMAPALPTEPVEFDDGAAGGYAWPEIAEAAATALGRPVRVLPVGRHTLLAVSAAASGWSWLTRRPMVLSLDKVGEIRHPDWVAAGVPLPDYVPAWNLVRGFRNTAEWAASRGLLRL